MENEESNKNLELLKNKAFYDRWLGFFTFFFIISLFCYIYLLYFNENVPLYANVDLVGFKIDTVGVAFFSLIISIIGTFSGFFFALRNERRNKIETALRIEKLELEIVELKSKAKENESKIILK